MNKPTSENLEALQFLSETHRALHKQRQMYEFRVLFTTLSFYGISVGAGLTEIANIPPDKTLLVWTGLLGMGALVSLFLFSLHQSNRRNLYLAEKCEVVMINQLRECGYDVGIMPSDKEDQTDPIKIQAPRFEKNWIWQSLIVFGFAILAAVALTK